jgi:hypothetical protein
MTALCQRREDVLHQRPSADRLVLACEVIAPTLVPTKAGGRVKTDRRDA